MREQRDLEAQLTEEGDQPEACFIVEALSLLRTRQDSLSSDAFADEPQNKTKEGIEARTLSSPEESSSGDSLSSMEEPLSPLSLTLGDGSFSSKPPPLDKSQKADVGKSVSTVEGAPYPNELPELGSSEEASGDKPVSTDEDAPNASKHPPLGTHCDKPVITVEDLDISQLQPVNHTTSGGQVSSCSA